MAERGGTAARAGATGAPGAVLLERDGVAIVLATMPVGLPAVLHWGGALGALPADARGAVPEMVGAQSAPGTLDHAWELSVAPAEGDGWAGRPAVRLRRAGVLHHPRWDDVQIESAGAIATVTATDAATGMRLRWRVSIEAGGLVAVDMSLSHEGEGMAPVEVDWLEPTLPVPAQTTHLTTFDGRWSREKRPVTTRVPAGAITRQSRRGRGGHDAPGVFLASTGRPRWPAGDVWAVHLAWSADVTYRSDRMTDAVPLIGAGELLRPGEIVLQPGQSYAAPRALFAYSDQGMDGIAARFHTWLRARPTHPSSPRPVTLNTWEAVYFDQEPHRLTALAELAATLGVERFVLDDGWFAGRRDDTTSLGDWTVDAAVWPEGLEPLAARVHELDMQFGLWFEPEMISLRSDAARRHPDWLLHAPGPEDPRLSWRHQYVLDLANPDAFAHVLGQMEELIGRLRLDYIKWDHNRDLVEAVHDGRPGVHAQTVAVYALIRTLKQRHPALEIESCSSGGARTDLGMMTLCDRVWASDSNDPVERQDIQRFTGLLLPPEMIGAHVGPPRSSTSGRVTDLSYRCATSLLGSAGLEWDIATCTPAELETIRSFIMAYKRLRPVMHTGAVTHPALRDPAWRATAFRARRPVAAGEVAAVVVVATVAGVQDARAERLRIAGLEPDRDYAVRLRTEFGQAQHGPGVPPWWRAGRLVARGAVLERIGLQLPTLWPQQAFVLQICAAEPADA
ncbi:alpha-galactosidase [Microbacterium kribbense]|uniref:alpha-galactosidase n=1 Tax=Microbacterium kribbense TaxID=433645 RepID=A0ABP7GXP8_9MICO